MSRGLCLCTFFVLLARLADGVVRSVSVSAEGNVESVSSHAVRKQQQHSGEVGGKVDGTIESSQWDCRAGFSRWRRGWSEAKKDFCCSRFALGCDRARADKLAKAASASGAEARSTFGVIASSGRMFTMADPGLNVQPRRSSSFVGVSKATPTNLLPGSEFLGLGYNIYKGNPITTNVNGDPGYQLQVFEYDYSDQQTTTDGKYSIPNAVQAVLLSGCDSQLQINTINSAYAYQRAISNGFSLGGGYDGVEFTFGLEAQNIRDTTDSNQNVYTTAQFECASYKLQVNPFIPPALSATFIAAVNGLPSTYDEDKYNFFIEQFGTSFITELRLGARFGQQLTFAYTTFDDFVKNGLSISTAISYEAYAKAGFTHNQSTSTTEKVASAIENEASFSVGGSYSTDPQTFFQNALNEPAPIYLSTLPIYTLLGAPWWTGTENLTAKQKLLEVAVNGYCEVLGNEMGISDPCTPPPPVPALVPSPAPKNGVHQICIKNTLNYGMRCTVTLSGANIDAANPPSHTSENLFFHNGVYCLPGNALAAEDGDLFHCSCHVLDKTVECNGTYTFEASSALNGFYECIGPREDLYCGLNGTSVLTTSR